MWRVREWMVVIALCCAAGSAAAEAPVDPRLAEAQAAFDAATKLKDAAHYDDAVKLANRALALREAVLGSAQLDVASSLSLLGELYYRQGEPVRAEPLAQRALDIREAILGKEHPDVASALHGLATIYYVERAFDRAVPLYERALAIREAALGKNHPDVGRTLTNLAMTYGEQGLYSRAEPLYERALVILEATLGKNHPEVARVLINLANFYNDQGLYDRAEPPIQRALAIFEALDKSHFNVADSLANLAIIYARQGWYDRAQALDERALAIREATLGKNHRRVAQSLTNLADRYYHQGLYSQAEPLQRRALAIFETVSKENTGVALALNNLGTIYLGQGQYGRAEPLLKHALAMREALNKDDPDIATSLSDLARLYSEQGLYTRAEPLHERSLAIREALFSTSNPEFAQSLTEFARLRLAQGRLAAALPLFTRGFTLSEERLRKEALTFSEVRLANFLEYLRTDEERLYTLLRAHPGDAGVRSLALTAVLLRKGRSIEELADTSRAVYRSLGEKDRQTFEKLRDLRTRLASLSLTSPDNLSAANHQQQLKELAAQGDALEADLAQRSAPLRALTALPPPDRIVARVAAALPKDGALIEFVTYADRPLVPRPGAPRAQVPGELRSLALVLFPDGRTHVLDLGPAALIDSAASRLRDALASPGGAYQMPAQALYQLAFRPLAPILGGVHRVFLAPDGQLGLVPFAALHDGRRFLVDAYDFTYLTSGKDLLPRPEGLTPAGSVVVVADPDFGAAPAAAPVSSRSASIDRFFSTPRADLADRPWEPLPGTRQEAEALQRLIPQAQLFLGADATKERLLHLAAPGILHIATHGFFLGDSPAPASTRAVGHFGAIAEGGPGQRPLDPLLRSGLVLAGARSAAKDGDARSRLDGSLVTALELAGLDLWGTQLVVLSACDTGRGDVKLGQGVYGLRRALVVAGAETLVTSLWKVNDETTRALMQSYYRHLLAGEGRAAALREAMLALRMKQPHPYFWAPFITLGDDAPLRGLAPATVAPPGPRPGP